MWENVGSEALGRAITPERKWEGKVVDGLHGVFLFVSLFFISLRLSSSSGCVAYGMGCVAVSHAPPPQLGSMAMAAPLSPLFFPSLLHSSPSGCVAYGMGCVAVSHAPPPQPGPMAMAAPSSSSFISLFFLTQKAE